MLNSLRLILRMIKFEHTLFALPFALMSLLVASDGRPRLGVLFWVIVAMVGARSTAMAFNRLVDMHYDAANPRTVARELPAGLLSRGSVLLFTLATAALLVIAASQLNRVCLVLSPAALAVVYFYSFCKRFTALSHLVLGLGLAIAPVGAWLAVRGEFGLFPILLAGAVLFWVAGFDTIYSCQDVEFDRRVGLFSLPANYGSGRALVVARLFHLLAVLLWLTAMRRAELGPAALVGVGTVSLLLLYEHWLVRGGDLRRIQRAFFDVNSYVGLVLFVFVAADLYIL
jgi:4-hydroxybenzoate polyprenyltransferase